nr:reverse transcriptase domain-containing protein [Tanacetum cinerariifolium]
MSIEINKKEKLQQLEQVANLNTYPSKCFNSFCNDDDDDEDYTVVITPDFLITDSLIVENEHLDTIPETESDKFIKSSVENLVPIPRTSMVEKSSQEDKSYSLLLPDVSLDTLRIRTRSSTLYFMNLSDSFLGIVLCFSFLMMRESSGSIVGKTGMIAIDEGTDIANITRKQPKPDKNEHENGKIEPELCTIVEMADNRTMEELLQAPTEGDVPNDLIKLMMFSYSLEGSARAWYDKEPPNSILTWEDLVNKFMNQFFPPSKTTYLKNEISCFTQRFEETFGKAWKRFKEMLRAFPHHGFTELA